MWPATGSCWGGGACELATVKSGQQREGSASRVGAGRCPECSGCCGPRFLLSVRPSASCPVHLLRASRPFLLSPDGGATPVSALCLGCPPDPPLTDRWRTMTVTQPQIPGCYHSAKNLVTCREPSLSSALCVGGRRCPSSSGRTPSPLSNALGAGARATPGSPSLRGAFASQGTYWQVFPLSVPSLVLPGNPVTSVLGAKMRHQAPDRPDTDPTRRARPLGGSQGAQ